MPLPLLLLPLLGAAAGAGLGALKNKKNRGKGALIGMGIGAGAGALGAGGLAALGASGTAGAGLAGTGLRTAVTFGGTQGIGPFASAAKYGAALKGGKAGLAAYKMNQLMPLAQTLAPALGGGSEAPEAEPLPPMYLPNNQILPPMSMPSSGQRPMAPPVQMTFNDVYRTTGIAPSQRGFY